MVSSIGGTYSNAAAVAAARRLRCEPDVLRLLYECRVRENKLSWRVKGEAREHSECAEGFGGAVCDGCGERPRERSEHGSP